MWPDRVSNPGPLTYESGALPIALRGPAHFLVDEDISVLLIHEHIIMCKKKSSFILTTCTKSSLRLFSIFS